MDENAKKRALRMIPYGMFVLTARGQDGHDVAAGTVNWLTQCSFQPPLVAVGVKVDSKLHQTIRESGAFALSVIGKDQLELAYKFFKPQKVEGEKLGDEPFEAGPATGSPLLLSSPAWWECKLVGEVAKGDHTLFVGEVVEAGVRREELSILMRDHNLNYGG